MNKLMCLQELTQNEYYYTETMNLVLARFRVRNIWLTSFKDDS